MMSEMQIVVFGGTGRPRFSEKPNPDSLGNAAGDFIVFPDACDLGIADAICQAIQCACRTRVRIRADNHLSGPCNFFTNHRVTDPAAAVGRSAMEPDTALLSKF